MLWRCRSFPTCSIWRTSASAADSVAGNSSALAASAGLKLPIESLALQAMVTEPVKPVLDTVIGSAVIHCYVSQSDRGEIVIGGGADPFHSYAQRGALPTTRDNANANLTT